MNYKAIIFDFDYTLADATEGIVKCFNYAFEKMGFPQQDTEVIRNTVGMTIANAFTLMTGCDDESVINKLRSHFKVLADKIMAESTKLLFHTKILLYNLKYDGVRTGIVTSKLRCRINDTLIKENLQDYINIIIGFDDVECPKPSPEGLLKAIEILNIPKEQVLYVGDNIIDAETAERANVDFVGVLTGTTTKSEFQIYSHKKIVKDLAVLEIFINNIKKVVEI